MGVGIWALGRANGDGELRVRGGDWFVGGCGMLLLYWQRTCGRMEELKTVRIKGLFGSETLPIARPGVLGILPSFLGTGESFRADNADATRMAV